MHEDTETLLSLYRTMVTIRKFETLAGEMFAAGKIPGFIHLSIGQEASSVGVCSVLRPDDYITTTHRGHGHVIAKGADLKKMFAELMGRKTGYCKGKGGSMHIADFSIGILGANGVVAGGFPIAVGAGLSIKLRFIIIGAGIFNAVFIFLGGGEVVRNALMSLPFGRWFILATMMFILFIGGFFISWQGLLYMLVPIFLPVVTALGFDQLWFALLVCVNLQMSFLTPPFAYAIFFVKGAAPPEITTWDIYRGVIPFVTLQAIGLVLCILYPEIILWLPRVTLGGGGR